MAEREHPDVILMDIVMPGMNGFQATRHLTKNPATASIPVVIVTSKYQETDRIWGLRQGAVSYITKPVGDAELVAAVRANIKS
jgi:twitching motility two-component system response regulator PilH